MKLKFAEGGRCWRSELWNAPRTCRFNAGSAPEKGSRQPFSGSVITGARFRRWCAGFTERVCNPAIERMGITAEDAALLGERKIDRIIRRTKFFDLGRRSRL